jgi:hypothetical protein
MISKSLYEQINSNLISQFDKACPPKENPIMTNVDEILDEFKKWCDFWMTKMPPISTDPYRHLSNELLDIKQFICEYKIVAILNELKRLGLHQQFHDKFNLR